MAFKRVFLYKILKDVFLLLLLTTPLIGKGQELEWVKSFGGSSSDYGYSTTIDNDGNSYITGKFSGTIDFDTGVNTAELTSNGYQDVFVLKLDVNGNYLWAKSFGGEASDTGESIIIDNEGNSYITGFFSGTVDFDPSANTAELTGNGDFDFFVLKLDANGDYLWVKSFGGFGPDRGAFINRDNRGDIYVTGRFQLTVDFDPSANTAELTSNGNQDIFVLKLDANGNYLWVKSFGGLESDIGFSLTHDNQGCSYVTGFFSGTIDFDSSTNTAELTSNGNQDIFILKLDANGDYLWAKSFGGSDSDYGFSITTDNQGSSYITGWFSETVDFDPSSNTAELISNGERDVFVLKLDVNGNYLWAKSFGGPDYDFGESITTDNEGGVYVTGLFTGIVDFDPNSNTTELTSNGTQDIFVLKLDANGGYLWAKSFGGSGSDAGRSITIDNEGGIYTTGWFKGSVDFDPSSNTVELTSNEGYDIFVLKLKDCNTNNNCALSSNDTDLGLNNKIKINPNPTNGVVTINQGNNSVLKLEIFNSTHKVFESIIDEKATKLDLSFFPSGVYLFKTTVKDEVTYEKIIVL